MKKERKELDQCFKEKVNELNSDEETSVKLFNTPPQSLIDYDSDYSEKTINTVKQSIKNMKLN